MLKYQQSPSLHVMKKMLMFFSIIPFLVSGQRIKTGLELGSKSEKKYVYTITFSEVTNLAYPGVLSTLSLMQNAAVVNNGVIVWPELTKVQSSLSSICPFVLYGYKKSSFPSAGSCNVMEDGPLEFDTKFNGGKRFKITIPASQVNSDTKLVIGTYAAVLKLPNGKVHRLSKASVRSFRLMDMDFPLRNYVKYIIDVDGAWLGFEYAIERSVIN